MGVPRNTDVADSLKNRTPFVLGRMAGKKIAFLSPKHQLPTAVEEQYRADQKRIAYTVYSFATPIGWVLEDDTVVIPDMVITTATKAHQALIRRHLEPRG